MSTLSTRNISWQELIFVEVILPLAVPNLYTYRIPFEYNQNVEKDKFQVLCRMSLCYAIFTMSRPRQPHVSCNEALNWNPFGCDDFLKRWIVIFIILADLKKKNNTLISLRLTGGWRATANIKAWRCLMTLSHKVPCWALKLHSPITGGRSGQRLVWPIGLEPPKSDLQIISKTRIRGGGV